MRVKVDVSMLPARQIMEGLGVTERGRVQQFLTDRVLHHMRPYMPYDTGAMADLQTMVTSPTTIFVAAPYAGYVYEGYAMKAPGNQGPFPVGNGEFRTRKGAKLQPTSKPLNYTKITHPKAGPHWDRTMMQEEGEQIAEEVQAYVRSMK